MSFFSRILHPTAPTLPYVQPANHTIIPCSHCLKVSQSFHHIISHPIGARLHSLRGTITISNCCDFIAAHCFTHQLLLTPLGSSLTHHTIRQQQSLYIITVVLRLHITSQSTAHHSLSAGYYCFLLLCTRCPDSSSASISAQRFTLTCNQSI